MKSLSSTIPACPHRPGCDGCPAYELSVAESLLSKQDEVTEAVGRFFDLEQVEVAACVPSPSPLGYRTRVKLAAAVDASGALRLGLFRAGTHDVMDIPQCPVAHPGLLPILDALRRLAVKFGVAVGLVHVDARWSLHEQAAHLTLVAWPEVPREPLLALGQALVAECPPLVGIGLRRAAGPTPRALSGATEPLCGRQALWESLGGRRFHLSPGAFFQVDPAAAEKLQEVVRSFLLAKEAGAARHIVDLYAGVGAFALCLAQGASQITMVESVGSAVADALTSAQDQRVSLEAIVSPVEEYAATLAHQKLDRVVLDPPRRGVPMSVLAAVGRGRPKRLAYVACDPQTAVRDLEVLRVFGLELRRAVPVDMFGRTNEVETVFCAERAAQPWRPDIAVCEPDFVVALKPAVLPTHPQGPGEPNLRDAVRLATQMNDLQPAHRLDVGTSGPVAFASGTVLSNLGRAFASGEVHKEYLALVRGVTRKKGTICLGRGTDWEEVSRYERLDVVGGYALVKVEPVSGKRHQIRRHLLSIDHPIVGDERYGDRRTNRYLAEQAALGRLFLHLHRLELPGPSGELVNIEVPLPPELVLVLERLSQRSSSTVTAP